MFLSPIFISLFAYVINCVIISKYFVYFISASSRCARSTRGSTWWKNMEEEDYAGGGWRKTSTSWNGAKFFKLKFLDTQISFLNIIFIFSTVNVNFIFKCFDNFCLSCYSLLTRLRAGTEDECCCSDGIGIYTKRGPSALSLHWPIAANYGAVLVLPSYWGWFIGD